MTDALQFRKKRKELADLAENTGQQKIQISAIKDLLMTMNLFYIRYLLSQLD